MKSQRDLNTLIASNRPSTRSALKILLKEQSDLIVISEAQDGHELLKKIESTCPDLILLDWDLLDRATPILIKTVCELNQNLKVILLTANSDHKQAAIDAGADAYVNIGDSPTVLLETIKNLSVEV